MKVKPIVAAIVLMSFALPARAAGDAVRGAELVESQCRPCYVSDTMPQPGGAPPGFRDIIRGHKLNRNQFRRFVTEPHYPMPPKAFSLSQIEDLVAYFDGAGYWP
mgnify:CR=1 FL=1